MAMCGSDCGYCSAARDDRDALIDAVTHGREACIRASLFKGAHPDAVTLMERTGLHLALERGDVTCAKLLWEAGADLHATDALNNGIDWYAGKHLASLEWLHSIGFNLVGDGVGHGCDALLTAVHRGRDDCVRFLIGIGADVNEFQYGHTALHEAARGQPDCLKELCRAGADVNAVTPLGYTALGMAARGGHVACVQHLLDFGANPHARGRFDKTPLFDAAEGGHQAVMRCLLRWTHCVDADACLPRDGMSVARLVCRKRGCARLLHSLGVDDSIF